MKNSINTMALLAGLIVITCFNACDKNMSSSNDLNMSSSSNLKINQNSLVATRSFTFTGSLNTARSNHTATLLPNGEVLVTGGWGAGTNDPLASAELYNPATGKWTFTGSMAYARTGQTATLLQNGEVLVAGGDRVTGIRVTGITAELYNPSTGKWTTTGSMIQPGYPQTATLLPSGEVLATGGDGYEGETLATAELYNPSTGTWSTTGSMNVGRVTVAGLLQNGQVLVAGGYSYSGLVGYTLLASAELYNPSTGKWSFTASMTKANSSPTPPVLLTNGDALVANAGQFYNPGMAAWTLTSKLPTIAGPPQVATLLHDGNVLASGTYCHFSGCGSTVVTACFLYATSTNSWSVTGSMNQARIHHTSTLLPSGKVLVAGGYVIAGAPLGSAELYTP
jgi:hypothetical protein